MMLCAFFNNFQSFIIFIVFPEVVYLYLWYAIIFFMKEIKIFILNEGKYPNYME